MELSQVLESVFRWIHIVAGIIWIGLLYFFNWVNAPFSATLDASAAAISTRPLIAPPPVPLLAAAAATVRPARLAFVMGAGGLPVPLPVPCCEAISAMTSATCCASSEPAGSCTARRRQ